jgi:UDP-N-acetylglucosamine--N-acetylmuramyl-(pentapeptide) pyrophosphoryl-undecaprenol N-acetylglucosamine transferase
MAVIETLTPSDDVLWIGTHGQMEEELVPRAGLRLETIAGGPIAGVPRLTQVRNGTKLALSVVSAWRIIGRFQPTALLLTGGYVNLPVALAARLRGVPSIVYLPDVEPGAAIRRIVPLVDKIACTTGDSAEFLPAEKLEVTGYPVRAELRKALALSVAEARQQFELDPTRKTLFVFGGSRGAQSINRALMGVLPELLKAAQVIHISGTLTWDETEQFAATLSAAERHYYRPFPYLHAEMGAAFRAADLIIARAGASMLGESPAFGVPAILVPYPHAWRYQKVNADWLAARGAGVQLDDGRMADELLPNVTSLLHNDVKLNAMKAAARELDVANSAAKIANALRNLTKNG